MKAPTLLLTALLATAFPSAARAGDEISIGTGAGQLHPDVELPTIDGERTLRISDFRGKRLLLIQFASW